MDSDLQILKCRDDKKPIAFSNPTDWPESEPPFTLSEGVGCSWLNKDESFGLEKLRPRIEPWLTALFQSEHLSLLVGSGLSHAVHHMATGGTLPGMAAAKFTAFEPEIILEAKRSAANSGREEGNIEDQIRTANELLRGLEILSPTDDGIKKKAAQLNKDLDGVLRKFADCILKGEQDLTVAGVPKLERAFNYLVSFLMSFASRTGTRDRLQIFTTNYDRFIEAGSEIAGLHLIDRFVGSLTPIFRASRLDVDMHYNPPGIRGEPRYLEGVAKFTKLHGSLDWVNIKNTIRRISLPFGAGSIEPYLAVPSGTQASHLMIYPNSAKDRETAAYPYVELFRDFAAAICRPNNSLICFGYSFGDEHINRVIEDMLTIPSSHLVIISRSDPLGKIMGTYEKLGRHAQITLMIGNHLGDFETLLDNYLPKPAIDRTTFRMAELLRSRWSAGQPESAADAKAAKTGEGSAV